MDFSTFNSVALAGPSAAGRTVASALAPRNATVQPTSKDSTSPTSGAASGSTGDSSDITSDDFLTLLVSELQNQDPTQPTDPNQYITQLAQVNSLQQLISINQGIGTLDSAASGAGNSSGSTGSPNAVSN